VKKVLILAYDFPPYNSIGAQRPASWLKYLPKFGIDVTVVTRHWEENINSPIDYIKSSINREVTEDTYFNTRVIRVPFNPNLRDKIIIKYGLDRFVFFRKFFSLLISILEFKFPRINATYTIYKAAESFLKQNKVDLIIATAEPFILFKYAQMLSEKYNINWIADYRDCWNHGPLIRNKGFLNRLIGKMMLGLEKNIVQTSLMITTPSPSYKKPLSELFNNKKIEVIYNGSDIEDNDELIDILPDNHCFEIAYAGIIYPHQKLEIFLDGLSKFVKVYKESNVKVVFYGLNFYPEMRERLLSYNQDLISIIKVTNRVSYDKVIRKLMNAHTLLLLSNEGADWLNAKVFDYLALKRPILFVKNDKGVLEKILDESGIGYKCSTSEDVKNNIEILYNEFYIKKNKFKNARNSEFFTRKKQAELFSKLILEENIISK
jgi:glycosyltransferase involved in cell wall biosynthesis